MLLYWLKLWSSSASIHRSIPVQKSNEERNEITVNEQKIGSHQFEMIQLEHCSLHHPLYVIHCRVALIRNQLRRVGHHCSRSADSNFLPRLCSHLNNFLMGIGMQGRNEGWTSRGPVLGEKPAWLVANTTSIAKGFWSHWPCSPLWCLGYLTMHAFSHCLLWWWVLVHLHGT